jgi:hypothetical protein
VVIDELETVVGEWDEPFFEEEIVRNLPIPFLSSPNKKNLSAGTLAPSLNVTGLLDSAIYPPLNAFLDEDKGIVFERASSFETRDISWSC